VPNSINTSFEQKLHNILIEGLIVESKIYHVIGGAMYGTKYPEGFPHKIIDAPKEVFHGTSDLSIKGIKRAGLDTKNHITAKRDIAIYSAHRAVARFGGNPVVIVIDTTKLADLSLGGTMVDFGIMKSIPPDAITRIYKVRSQSGKDQAVGYSDYIGPQSYHQEVE